MAIKYLSLTGLSQYDGLIKAFIDSKVAEGIATSFKAVNLVDGFLKFYTETPIGEDAVAAYEVELPEQDLSHLMQLVENAVAGNIATFGDNGQVVDSGVALSSLATQASVDEVSDKVDALDKYVGEIPSGEAYADITTVIGYVNKKAEETLAQASGGSTESAASVLAALNTYKSENDPKVTANTEAIEVLNGDASVEGSVDKKVTDAINAFATQMTDNGTIDTFKEIVNYISTHGGEAAEMAAAISALEILVGEKSVAVQIAEAIEAENLDQYATDEELAAAIARIVVLEGKAHEHTNKDVLDGITSELVTNWNNAEANAKTYADEEIDKVEAIIGTVPEGKDVVTMIGEAQASAVESAGSYTDTEVGKVSDSVTTLSETHATDKAELQGNIDTVAGDLTALEESIVEVSTEEIAGLFQAE